MLSDSFVKIKGKRIVLAAYTIFIEMRITCYVSWYLDIESVNVDLEWRLIRIEGKLYINRGPFKLNESKNSVEFQFIT